VRQPGRRPRRGPRRSRSVRRFVALAEAGLPRVLGHRQPSPGCTPFHVRDMPARCRSYSYSGVEGLGAGSDAYHLRPLRHCRVNRFTSDVRDGIAAS